MYGYKVFNPFRTDASQYAGYTDLRFSDIQKQARKITAYLAGIV